MKYQTKERLQKDIARPFALKSEISCVVDKKKVKRVSKGAVFIPHIDCKDIEIAMNLKEIDKNTPILAINGFKDNVPFIERKLKELGFKKFTVVNKMAENVTKEDLLNFFGKVQPDYMYFDPCGMISTNVEFLVNAISIFAPKSHIAITGYTNFRNSKAGGRGNDDLANHVSEEYYYPESFGSEQFYNVENGKVVSNLLANHLYWNQMIVVAILFMRFQKIKFLKNCNYRDGSDMFVISSDCETSCKKEDKNEVNIFMEAFKNCVNKNLDKNDVDEFNKWNEIFNLGLPHRIKIEETIDTNKLVFGHVFIENGEELIVNNKGKVVSKKWYDAGILAKQTREKNKLSLV